jgi:hypothetical protein
LRAIAREPLSGNLALVIEYRINEFLRAEDDTRLALERWRDAIEAEAAEEPSLRVGDSARLREHAAQKVHHGERVGLIAARSRCDQNKPVV